MCPDTFPSDVRTARLHNALEDTRHLLIDHINQTISELQNALIRVSATRVPLDNQLAQVALHELVADDPDARVRAATVMAVTAEFYGFTTDQLRGRRGTKSLTWARHIAMYLCRELADLSLPQIGHEFDRDHTTAMHGIRRIREELPISHRAQDEIRDLTVLIKRCAVTDALATVRKPTPRPRRVA